MSTLNINLLLIIVLLQFALFRIEPAVMVLILLVGCLTVLLIKQRKILALLGAVTLILLANFHASRIWQDSQSINDIIGQQVVVRGVVVDDAVYGWRKQVDFYIDDLEINEQSYPGKYRISGYGTIDVKRGDRVQASGRLNDGFGSYQASINFADYHVLATTENLAERFRHQFIASSYTVLPEPQASLGLGFLAGFRSLLPEELSRQLSVTGLTHIVAVSGYNTTIISLALQRLLADKLSRFMVVVLIVLFLGFFLAITGRAPSIIRASIVSILSLLAWYYGRRISASTLLLGSAVISILINPLFFWYSLGWWLSFLAFFGVLVIAPLLQKKLIKSSNAIFKLAIETTAAQLMTLPLIAWVFSDVSVVAVISNLLVLPVIPVAMLFTFLSGLSAILIPAFVGIFSVAAEFVLSYIVEIVAWLAKLPFTTISISLNTTEMVVIYLYILAITAIISSKSKLSTKSQYALY